MSFTANAEDCLGQRLLRTRHQERMRRRHQPGQGQGREAGIRRAVSFRRACMRRILQGRELLPAFRITESQVGAWFRPAKIKET